MQRKTKIQDTW